MDKNMTRLLPKHISIPVTVLVLFLLSTSNAFTEELTLAVANSTCNAMQKVGKLYQQNKGDISLKYICKSSGRLAKGLHGKAIEADIYVSANRKWMDYIIGVELASPERVISPWGNDLVVATPLNSNITAFNWNDLASEKVKAIYIGDPGTAPFGRYAKQALTSTNLWEQVKHKIHTKKHITLLAENLTMASPNSVGILFFSNVNDSLRVIHTIDASWHEPIFYYLAPINKTETNEHVASMLDFIKSDAARTIFLEEGFKLTNP